MGGGARCDTYTKTASEHLLSSQPSRVQGGSERPLAVSLTETVMLLETDLTQRATAAGARKIVMLEGGGIRFNWRGHVVELVLESGDEPRTVLAFKDKGADNMSWEMFDVDEAMIDQFFSNPESFWGW